MEDNKDNYNGEVEWVVPEYEELLNKQNEGDIEKVEDLEEKNEEEKEIKNLDEQIEQKMQELEEISRNRGLPRTAPQIRRCAPCADRRSR